MTPAAFAASAVVYGRALIPLQIAFELTCVKLFSIVRKKKPRLSREPKDIRLVNHRIRRRHSPHKTIGQATERKTSLSADDNMFVALWTRGLFYTQDNPPELQSPTMKKLYEEYLRRVETMIGSVASGRGWARHAQIAIQAKVLGERLFPHAPRITDDELLVWLVCRGGATVKRAREIADAACKPKKHRPIDAHTFCEAIRAYDLKLRHMNPSQIANEICPCGSSRHSRTCIEKIRQRIRSVQSILNTSRDGTQNK